MPRRDDLHSTQDEYQKEIKKRGWSAERSIQELRANRFCDKDGQMRVNTNNMTKEA